MRKPLPKSEAVIGLLLLAVGGVSLSMMSAILLPRLFTSKKSWWLPRDGSTGRRITVSAENSILPALLRGALSRSNTDSLWEFSGSTSKKTVPVSFSYDPTEPNEAPPAIGWREAITIRVTRASAPLASMEMRNIDSAPNTRLDSMEPPFCGDRSGRAAPTNPRDLCRDRPQMPAMTDSPWIGDDVPRGAACQGGSRQAVAGHLMLGRSPRVDARMRRSILRSCGGSRSAASYSWSTSRNSAPNDALAATAHSGLLFEMIATRSPRPIPIDASPARNASVAFARSRYVVQCHSPARFVPNSSLSGYVSMALS